ncbi:IS256 family transposase [Streptomyces sp. NBC_00354]
MAEKTEPVASPAGDAWVDEVVERLLDSADASGAALLGEGGLLTEITRAVLERALEAEMSEHLGYERGDPAGHGSGNSRNGTSPKTVLTDAGAVALASVTATATSKHVWSRRRHAGSPGSTTGSVVSKPVYLAVGVDMDGRKDVLGLWVGAEGEGATTWMAVLSELRNRGIEDVCIVVCDGLNGLPDAVTATCPKATVQTCVIHLTRASPRLSSVRDHPRLTPALKTIYTAPTEQAAEQALDAFAASDLGERYPAIVRTWRSAWSEFTPYLALPPAIRKVVYSTNMVEPINSRLRKATRNRGRFPSEQAALKVLYLAVREQINPKARDANHVPAHWKEALNQFSLFFEDRLSIQ